MPRQILIDTIAAIRERLDDLDGTLIERAVVGLFFTGVKLSTGHAGCAATPIKEIPEAVCCPSSAMAMPFPGKLKGRKAAALMEEAVESTGIRRALGIAVLNALAQAAAERRADAGTELLGGVEITDPDAFLDVLAEGGSGYHFFGRTARKIVLRRTDLRQPRSGQQQVA